MLVLDRAMLSVVANYFLSVGVEKSGYVNGIALLCNML